MIDLQLGSYLKNATPEEVFRALSDRPGLKTLMPRMRKVEFRDRRSNSETVVMHISIGSTFGTIPCEGVLSWVEPDEVKLNITNPLPVQMLWRLAAAVNGTEMNISLNLDLEPLLGKMERFVPKNVVKELMVKEMTHAIKQIALRVKENGTVERAAAA